MCAGPPVPSIAAAREEDSGARRNPPQRVPGTVEKAGADAPMPQLKYCRSYSRECGKRSARGRPGVGGATEMGRPTAGGGRSRGLGQG